MHRVIRGLRRVFSAQVTWIKHFLKCTRLNRGPKGRGRKHFFSCLGTLMPPNFFVNNNRILMPSNWNQSHCISVFESHPKCRILSYSILVFSANFTFLSGSTVRPKTLLGIFNELLSTQKVNVECDFFCDFQTPCIAWFLPFPFWQVKSNLPSAVLVYILVVKSYWSL